MPNAAQAFELTKRGIALVVDPAIELVTQSGGVKAGSSSSDNFWIEGKINARGTDTGIEIKSTYYGRLNKLTLKNAELDGISMSNSPLNKLTHVTVINSGKSGLVIDMTNPDLIGLGIGVDIADSNFSNNGESGIFLKGSYNHLTNVSASSNQLSGLIISSTTNIVSSSNFSNNIENGLLIEGAQDNLLSALTIANNNGYGIHLANVGVNQPINNALIFATIANNQLVAIQFDTSSETNKLLNILDAFNAPSTCALCENLIIVSTDTASDAIFANASSDPNVNNYSVDNTFSKSDISNYTHLSNSFRNWGHSNTATAEAGSGSCMIGTNTCEIFDWSLKAIATIALDTGAEPANLNTFIFANGNNISYLENSLEINTDTIGNNNGYCEANETCLLATNNGSYQGHGLVTDYTGTNNIWSASGIVLQKYSINGY